MKNDKTNIDFILDSVRKIESYVIDYDKTMFINDGKTQSAILMQLTLIGELSKKISDETKNMIDLPWKNIAGFRDRAIHNYFDIKVDVVWDTLQQDIPELKEKLRIFLDSK